MSIFVDRKYISMVSHRLSRYQEKSYSPFAAAFRCPFCGDSKKSETKTRGTFYQTNDSINFKCFNCGDSRGLYKFLLEVDQVAAKDYVAESILSKNFKLAPEKEPEVKEEVRVEVKGLIRIDSLPEGHPVFTYLEKRKIPKKHYSDMFFVKKFNEWINTKLPDKLNTKYDEPRLVIPFFDAGKKLFGVTGRSFNPKTTLRYMTIMFDDNENKIFGLDRIDFSRKYYVFEGAIDSFFVDNSLAMAGADARIDALPNKSNRIIVLDNEPRNVEIHKRMSKLIDSGERVCIWPTHIKPKDVNQMILDGITNVQKIIDDNTFNGLMAKANLSFWTKA